VAIWRSESKGSPDLSGRTRFLTALEGGDLAFAPIVWERLPELVRQERHGWWQDPTRGQRLISDAAAVAGADAMFVFVAAEAVRCAVVAGTRGDSALDSFAQSAGATRGTELVACVREVAQHAVIAALPTPVSLLRELEGTEIEAAEDAFTDLASGYLHAGADALAVTGADADEVRAGVLRAGDLGRLFGRPALGICVAAGEVSGWDRDGAPIGVISSAGEWPACTFGVVITSGDVSAHWDAARLRAVGSARP
jgi:hypothetical protein